MAQRCQIDVVQGGLQPLTTSKCHEWGLFPFSAAGHLVMFCLAETVGMASAFNNLGAAPGTRTLGMNAATIDWTASKQNRINWHD